MVLGNRFNPHRFSGSEEYIKNRKLGRLFTPLIIKDTSHLDAAMCEQLTRGDTIPPILFTWSHASILKFLAGFADGNAMPFKCGYRFYGIESQLRELQLLLTKHGIFTSIHPRSSAVIKPPYEKNEWCMRVFYLIGLEVKRATQVFSYPISIPNMSQVIIKVEELPGTHESFCVTEPKLHQCVFNNVLTKQCNLTELNVSDLHDQDEFNERARAAAFIGTLQASYTNFHYIRPCWKKATEEDALLGVSMTGIASGGVMELDQVQAAAVVVYENERVASRLNINTAARTTLTKPSGCFDESTPIKTTTGIKSLHEIFKLNGIDPYTTDIGFHEIKEMVLVYDMNNIAQPITRLFNNGVEETLSIEFEDGVVINCTSNHRFLTTEGWKRADELTEHSDVIHF
jgi:hypothetical protein